MTSIAPLDPTAPVAPVASARSLGTNEPAPVLPDQKSLTSGTGSFSTSIDSALGITVLKFFSAAGDLTQSFPSQKQLASYQLYGLDSGSAAAAADGDRAT